MSSGLGRTPINRRPQMLPSQARRVDDFKRPEGLHVTANNKLQTEWQPTPQRSLPQLAKSFATPNIEETDKPKKSLLRRLFKRRPTSIRRTMQLSCAMLAAVLIVGGFLATKGYLKLHKVFQGGATAAALQTNVDPSLLKGEGDGRINILLLGVGGDGHDGADLTDTIMVASIDPINNKVALVSVPRDMWVKMPNNYISNYQKINAAYESGKYKYLGEQNSSNANKKAINAGFAAADSTVEQVLGVPIHYNMLVDFQAFRQAVDTVGGVTVNVPSQLYDPTMAWENNYNPILAKAGVQNFDGKHALIYVRSRETSSDFARSERQRSVMLALKDKVLTAGTLSNPLKISKLISAFGDNVQTDISLSDMAKLTTIMKKIGNNSVQSVGLGDENNSFVTTGNINGISVVEPKAGLEDYSAIQTYIRGLLRDGYITRENANVSVLNGTTLPGLASQKAAELKSYGYNVGTVGNTPTSDYQQTQIIDLTHGKDKYTLHYLQDRYGVQSITTTVPAGITAGTANIMVILGQDATTTN